MGVPKAWDKALGKRLWQDGLSDEQIAKACDVQRSVVYYYRRKHWEQETGRDETAGEGLDGGAARTGDAASCGKEESMEEKGMKDKEPTQTVDCVSRAEYDRVAALLAEAVSRAEHAQEQLRRMKNVIVRMALQMHGGDD